MPTHQLLSHCPICQAAAKPLDIAISYGLPCFKERVRIVFTRCPSCAFVFQSNPLERADMATYYSASPRFRSAEDYDPLERLLHQTQLGFMVGNGLRPRSTLLDIGAEMGRLLDLAKKRYDAVTAYIEDSVFACEYINAHGRHRQIVELGENDRFDWVILSQVLEHIVDPVDFLRSLRPHVVDDGGVFIEVPCHAFWNNTECHFSFEHVNYFSPAALTATLQAAGFVTINAEIGTDARYWGGRLKYIRLAAQKSAVPQQDEVIAHYRREMGDRFAHLKSLASRHRDKGKLALYGAAELADLVFNNVPFEQGDVVAIFDTDTKKHGTRYHGLTVHSALDIPVINPALIVVLSGAETAIRDTIKRSGFTGSIIGWSEL